MLTSCQVNPHQFSARVVDFGLSRSNTAAEHVSQNMYGTITHMAPEVMAGENTGKVGKTCKQDLPCWCRHLQQHSNASAYSSLPLCPRVAMLCPQHLA